MRQSFVFIFLFSCFSAFSQVVLPYSINNGPLPSDSDQVVAYTPYIDSTDLFIASGFHTGDTVPDFTLYDTASQAHQLETILSDGKPVLLASVSLTCPASRRSMQLVLPTLTANYGSQVNFVLVYTLEAHPIGPDFCPYSDTVNTTVQNYQDSILFPQPVNYYQRKRMAKRFSNLFAPAATLVIDGPGNEFWSAFGPAPNNAYLLTPEGVVYRKYGWMSRSVTDIMQDIPDLLLTTGTQSPVSADLISVYPNPSNGPATVSVKGANTWYLSIYDLSGRCVATEEDIHAQTADLEQYHLANGTYLLLIRTATAQKNLPFIVQ